MDRLLFELPRLLTVPLPDELRLLLRCRTVPLLRLLLLPLLRTVPLLRLLLLPLLRTVPLPERLPDDLFTDRPVLLEVDLLLTVLLVVPRDRTVPVERRILERDVDLSIWRLLMFERALERVVRILERASARVRPDPLTPEEYKPELLI